MGRVIDDYEGVQFSADAVLRNLNLRMTWRRSERTDDAPSSFYSGRQIHFRYWS